MKKLLATTCLAAGLFGLAGAASAAECGDVTIANMNWQSAEVLASVDKIILTEGYGCNAELVVGDTVPTITSMAEKGQPDIAHVTVVTVEQREPQAPKRRRVSGPSLRLVLIHRRTRHDRSVGFRR